MDLPPCGRGALVVPPSAAGIAGSRPGAMFWICRSSHGGFQFSALRAECLFTRPSGALQMCRLRQRRLPGPAPAGGPTSCAPKKSAEEGRSRGLPPVPLRNPREYLASTRRLPSLPTGTPAEGSIQVAGAPNRWEQETCQKGAPPVGGAPKMRMVCYACLPGSTPGTVPETLGQRHCARGAAAGGMRYTCPLIREPGAADFGRRPTGGGAGVAGAKPLVPSLVPFLGKQERNSLSVDYRQTPPLTERRLRSPPAPPRGKARRRSRSARACHPA